MRILYYTIKKITSAGVDFGRSGSSKSGCISDDNQLSVSDELSISDANQLSVLDNQLSEGN